MNENEKQFSFTRAALSTGGRAKTKFLSVTQARSENPVAREPPKELREVILSTAAL